MKFGLVISLVRQHDLFLQHLSNFGLNLHMRLESNPPLVLLSLSLLMKLSLKPHEGS
jgi:hypothetical protein